MEPNKDATRQLIEGSLAEMEDELHRFVQAPENVASIERGITLMADALANGHKIMACGNGGSLCDATHFAEELTGRYRHNRRPLPAIAMNDPAYLTCTGNDFAFDAVFARYVEGVGVPGDVLLAISTSGTSANVVNAAEQARSMGLKVVALTTATQNPLRALADVAICAPQAPYSDRIQEIHIKVIHIFIQGIEQQLNNRQLL